MDTYSEEVKKLEDINSEINKNNSNYKMYHSDKKDSISVKKTLAFSLFFSSLFLDGVYIVSSLSNPILQGANSYIYSFVTVGLVTSGLIIFSALLDKNRIKNMEEKHNLKAKQLENLREESLNKIKSLEIAKNSTEIFEETNNDEKKILENIKKEIEFLLANDSDKNKVKTL